jgi:hypothetical protein
MSLANSTYSLPCGLLAPLRQLYDKRATSKLHNDMSRSAHDKQRLRDKAQELVWKIITPSSPIGVDADVLLDSWQRQNATRS